MDCCKRLLTELARPEEDRDAVVPQALWSSALVAYTRCFGKGGRSGLATEDVRSLPLHVHPANPFEAAKVGAALSPLGQTGRRVEGIAVFSASHVLIDDIGVRQLGGLASELAKQTAEKAQEQQESVLAEAQQLNIDSLYRLPPLRMR